MRRPDEVRHDLRNGSSDLPQPAAAAQWTGSADRPRAGFGFLLLLAMLPVAVLVGGQHWMEVRRKAWADRHLTRAAAERLAILTANASFDTQLSTIGDRLRSLLAGLAASLTDPDARRQAEARHQWRWTQRRLLTAPFPPHEMWTFAFPAPRQPTRSPPHHSPSADLPARETKPTSKDPRTEPSDLLGEPEIILRPSAIGVGQRTMAQLALHLARVAWRPTAPDDDRGRGQRLLSTILGSKLSLRLVAIEMRGQPTRVMYRRQFATLLWNLVTDESGRPSAAFMLLVPDGWQVETAGMDLARRQVRTLLSDLDGTSTGSGRDEAARPWHVALLPILGQTTTAGVDPVLRRSATFNRWWRGFRRRLSPGRIRRLGLPWGLHLTPGHRLFARQVPGQNCIAVVVMPQTIERRGVPPSIPLTLLGLLVATLWRAARRLPRIGLRWRFGGLFLLASSLPLALGWTVGNLWRAERREALTERAHRNLAETVTQLRREIWAQNQRYLACLRKLLANRDWVAALGRPNWAADPETLRATTAAFRDARGTLPISVLGIVGNGRERLATMTVGTGNRIDPSGVLDSYSHGLRQAVRELDRTLSPKLVLPPDPSTADDRLVASVYESATNSPLSQQMLRARGELVSLRLGRMPSWEVHEFVRLPAGDHRGLFILWDHGSLERATLPSVLLALAARHPTLELLALRRAGTGWQTLPELPRTPVDRVAVTLAARAAASREPMTVTTANREHLVLAAPSEHGTDVVLIAATSLRRIEEELTANARWGTGVLALSAMVLLLLGFWSGSQVVTPVEAIRIGLEAVGRGELDRELGLARSDELGRLSRSFDQMIAGLRTRQRLSTLVSDQALAAIATGDDLATVANGRRLDAVVLVSDIRGFTTHCESQTPDTMNALLSAHYTLMARAIQDFGGRVDRFIGDAIQAVFEVPPPPAPDANLSRSGSASEPGAPDAIPAARRALLAARAMLQELAAINHRRRVAGAFPYQIGIGLAAGPIVIGGIGSIAGRIDLTMVGDAVAAAHRLEGLTRHLPGIPLVADVEVCRQSGLPPDCFQPVQLEGHSGLTLRSLAFDRVRDRPEAPPDAGCTAIEEPTTGPVAPRETNASRRHPGGNGALSPIVGDGPVAPRPTELCRQRTPYHGSESVSDGDGTGTSRAEPIRAGPTLPDVEAADRTRAGEPTKPAHSERASGWSRRWVLLLGTFLLLLPGAVIRRGLSEAETYADEWGASEARRRNQEALTELGQPGYLHDALADRLRQVAADAVAAATDRDPAEPRPHLGEALAMRLEMLDGVELLSAQILTVGTWPERHPDPHWETRPEYPRPGWSTLAIRHPGPIWLWEFGCTHPEATRWGRYTLANHLRVRGEPACTWDPKTHDWLESGLLTHLGLVTTQYDLRQGYCGKVLPSTGPDGRPALFFWMPLVERTDAALDATLQGAALAPSGSSLPTALHRTARWHGAMQLRLRLPPIARQQLPAHLVAQPHHRATGIALVPIDDPGSAAFSAGFPPVLRQAVGTDTVRELRLEGWLANAAFVAIDPPCVAWAATRIDARAADAPPTTANALGLVGWAAVALWALALATLILTACTDAGLNRSLTGQVLGGFLLVSLLPLAFVVQVSAGWLSEARLQDGEQEIRRLWERLDEAEDRAFCWRPWLYHHCERVAADRDLLAAARRARRIITTPSASPDELLAARAELAAQLTTIARDGVVRRFHASVQKLLLAGEDGVRGATTVREASTTTTGTDHDLLTDMLAAVFLDRARLLRASRSEASQAAGSMVESARDDMMLDAGARAIVSVYGGELWTRLLNRWGVPALWESGVGSEMVLISTLSAPADRPGRTRPLRRSRRAAARPKVPPRPGTPVRRAPDGSTHEWPEFGLIWLVRPDDGDRASARDTIAQQAGDHPVFIARADWANQPPTPAAGEAIVGLQRAFNLVLSTNGRIGQQCELGGSRYRIEARPGRHHNNLLWAALAPQAPLDSAAERRVRVVILAILAAVLATLLIAWSAAGDLLDPIARLQAAMATIDRGEFSHRLAITRNDELGDLALSFNRMARGLEERELLARMVSAAARKAVGYDGASAPGATATVRDATILFLSIPGFHDIAAGIAPTLLMTRLNQWSAAVCTEIGSAGGDIDKMLGDKILAVFYHDHRTAAEAARAAATAGCRLLAAWRRRELPFPIAGGMHTGSVLIGLIGAGERRDHTVIGDVVNTAARLAALAETCTGEPALLGTSTTRQLLEASARLTWPAGGQPPVANPLGPMTIKGKRNQIVVFRIEEPDLPSTPCARSSTQTRPVP